MFGWKRNNKQPEEVQCLETPAKIQRTESCLQLETPPPSLMTPSGGMAEEEESLRVSCLEQSNAGMKRRAPSVYVPPCVADVAKRMKKDTSLPSFVPLSSGKFMSDVWWEPTDVEVRPAKKKGGLPWILVAVKMFFDFGGNTLDVDSEAECRNMYRLSVFDALYIAFLRMRMLADIHSEIYPADYEKWLEFMQKDLGYKEGDSMIEVAAKCLKVSLESALVLLPGTFRIMFQNKPHMALEDTE